MLRSIFKLTALCLLAGSFLTVARAQIERPELIQRPELVQGEDGGARFELGQRLRAVEAAWDANTDAAARKRAAFILQNAVNKFLGANPGAAARALDQARFMLQGGDTAPEKLWAESLYLKPETRLWDVAGASLSFTLEQLYPVPVPLPEGAQLRVEVGVPGRKPAPAWQGEVKELPAAGGIVLRGVPEGDYLLHTALSVKGKLLASSDLTVSCGVRIAARVAQLRQEADALPATATEGATARLLTDILEKLARKEALETNYPAAQLLKEAEALTAAAKQKRSTLGQKRAGQFWLSLALDEKDALPVRLAVPEAAKTGQPLPLVIALHGAGGSENLFFDGYGRGAAVRLAQQRGWLLVAPRNFGPDAARLALTLDALDKLYPIDRKRIFLVGHSLGAVQSVALASNMPDKIAGVAALGGGGRPRGYDELKPLPFFIGIGTGDFAYGGAQTLKNALEQIGVAHIVYREYPEVEHIAIVQVALPEVFAFFDEIAARR